MNARREKLTTGKFSAQGLAYVISIVAGIVALTSLFVASASEVHFRSSVTDSKPQWDFQKYSGLMFILSYSSYPRVSKEIELAL